VLRDDARGRDDYAVPLVAGDDLRGKGVSATGQR
jgi:hypothetical protein